ncbi:acyltransferase family protein [Sphingomonas cannabina]|uniref:acyltransferase family protein n=1 Tax=Sphingomonas cannabina TaxID=2899123 RepID=UPI001F1BCBFE|nr:acyltransferase family protein [Sphingomonas cannabina]UIJ46455.1 acyltransferase family protein [Sphingomonas cannabina]
MHQPPAAQFATTISQRHFGMDWLRIAAFALLILYHAAMVFAPWSWVVKWPVTYPALIPPMAALTPWRLALLFAVSGYASRKLLARSDGLGAFLKSRHARLLIPLAFGMAVLAPIEMWVRVREHGYPSGYLHFWALDYWRWGRFWGVSFPNWEHLWFVAYLWGYTMVLGAVVARAGAGWGDRLLGWLGERRRLLWAPPAALTVAKLSLMFVVPEQQGLFTDWSAHVEYWPIFAFGFVVAGNAAAWPMIARIWRPALAAAVAAGAVVIAIEVAYPADTLPPHAIAALDRAARVAMAWWMVLALFHLADTYLNRDHRWRRPLAEAVFPAYLIHHTTIVIVAWWTLDLRISPWIEFALLAVASIGASAAVYLVGRRIGWLRPLIGLSRKPVPTAAAQLRPAL